MTTTHTDSVRGHPVLALVLLLSVGCVTNRATVSPVGTVARIQVGDIGDAQRTVSGELIEVREDGFLILSDPRSDLMFLPYGRILDIDFESEVDVDTSVHGMQNDQARRRSLARFSRYPFGIDDTSLRRLLEAYGQSELVVIRF